MADRQALENALIKAHEAGDTEAASVIAGEIKGLSPSFGERAARVAGLGARSLITGVSSIPTLMAEGVAAPLRALTGGKYFPSPTAVLQEKMTQAGLPEPANAPERFSTAITSALAGMGGTLGAAGAVNPTSIVGQGVRDTLLQQPVRQAVAAGTGAASGQAAAEAGAGPVGQMGATLAGGMAPFAPQMMAGRPSPETLQTRQTAAQGREAGYVLPPQQVNPSVTNKLLGGFSGQARTEQAASLKNQTVTNRLARQDLGLPQDAPLNEATLESFRNRVSGPYREVEALLPNGKSLMEQLKTARANANDWWKHYNRDAHPESKAKAIQFSQDAQAIEATFESAAQASGKPDLLGQLRQSRTQIAKSYDYERALNQDTGNIDARMIGRARDKGAPQTGPMRTIGSMANAFDRSMQSMDGRTPPFVSPLDAATATVPLAGAIMSGRPEVAALSALPFLRPAVRAGILSEPYQTLMASPNVSPLTNSQAGTLGILPMLYSRP